MCQTVPDIVALNQIALGHEMLGEFEAARQHFTYVEAAEAGLARLT